MEDEANWAGARFAESTTINSDSPDQLDCMDADDFEPTDNVGPSDSTPCPGGVAEASNNTYLRPSVPHTPWFRVIDARRKKVVAEEGSATPPATLHQREHRHGTGWSRLPRLPVEDHKVIFRIRGGISLQQEAVLSLRAAIQTALRAPLPMSARIRVRKEQNIALVSTSDPDLAVQLCHVQTLKLGSRSYEVSAYVASPDNSCKGVITGALPIPTEDALMNERHCHLSPKPFRPVTQVCHCCLRTGHRHDICQYPQERRCGNCGILNPSEHHDGSVPRCLTCGSDEHPTIDLGCPARQRRPGPRVLRDERQLLEKPNDPPLKQLSEQLPPNNQPRSRPQHASIEGHGSSAQSKCSKTPKHGKQTSQPIQPGAPPPIQASAHSSRNYPPPSSQCSAKSYNTWPALLQREPTHAPGLEARAVASSSSGLAAGGRLDQAPQSQLQRRQDPLAVPGKSPVEQASQNLSRSTPPHSPPLVQQTCAQYFQTPEFTQALTQLVLKFVNDSLEAVKTQLINEQEQALQRMETTFSHRMEKVEAAINHLYDMEAQSSPTRKHKQRKSAAASFQHTAQANSPQSGVSTPTTTQHGEF
ncbi:hypothetical protein HPB51_018368 [Rhipicephalus microplus]|uniref:Uncharacterized protein n=1 Tax=Rhipicephalus microplus TaxID=6941 RepID=A0A9J6EUV5_RHIMP|nr:hypothetical protein HPB51_018368 [Rhipicephalus microplus]